MNCASDRSAFHTFRLVSAVLRHTMGYAFQAATTPTGMHSKEHIDVEATLIAAREHFQDVARLASLLASCEYGSEYAFGPEIIIDGLEARLTSTN